MIYRIYRVAYSYINCYDICDPLAVAAALEPSTINSYIEKNCVVETEGKFTKGMVVVDWFDRIPHECKYKCKIVTSMKR